MVRCINSPQIVVGNVAHNNGGYLRFAQSRGLDPVELFLLQCSKKALHSCIVVATPSAAHALYRIMFEQGRTKYSAGVLAPPIRVQNHPSCPGAPTGQFKGFYAEFCVHSVLNLVSYNTSVITIQNRSKIYFPIFTGNLCDIRQPLFVRHLSCKILFDQIFRLFRLSIRFRDTIRFSFRSNHKSIFFANSSYRPLASGITYPLLQPEEYSLHTVVCILGVLRNTLFDLRQKM